MKFISYKKGYKYQLYKNYTIYIPLLPDDEVESPYICLTKEGILTIKKGYAWDGPSGPTPDVCSFMRGALVHDALYQLMRNRYLDHDIHRNTADRLLQTMCREDGMNFIAAWFVYLGVKYGGGLAADPANKKPEIQAPEA